MCGYETSQHWYASTACSERNDDNDLSALKPRKRDGGGSSDDLSLKYVNIFVYIELY
jgi:hypothetical protein